MKYNPERQVNTKSYWEKRLQDNWGLHGIGYIGYGNYYNQWLYKVRKKVFSYQIKNLGISSFEKLKILDIGSGTGFYLDLWKSLGAKTITGSDLTKFAVEQLKESYPRFSIVQFDIGASFKSQGFFKRKFDIITAFDILFHIIDNNKFRNAIFNISSLLDLGGYFIFSDNFLHGKTIRTKYQANRSIEEISNILKEAGFKIIKRIPIFILMNAPIDIKSRYPLLLWRLLMFPVRAFNFLGFLYGAILYPIEVVLIKLLNESFSTEMMICQKAG